jgi:chromosomal replication initiation ATPase DnaA
VTEIETLRRRIEALEQLVRPLKAAGDAMRSSDDRVLAAIAEQLGVATERIQGDERARAVTGARRVAARILRMEARWSIGRIARVLRKDKATVLGMLQK